MTNSQAAALVAAGRLLQARGWPGGPVKIEKRPGETYPQAVARVVATLEAAERDWLRGLVAWVLDYDRHESSAFSPATAGTSPRGAP